jgi:hypothetical protein
LTVPAPSRSSSEVDSYWYSRVEELERERDSYRREVWRLTPTAWQTLANFLIPFGLGAIVLWILVDAGQLGVKDGAFRDGYRTGHEDGVEWATFFRACNDREDRRLAAEMDKPVEALTNQERRDVAVFCGNATDERVRELRERLEDSD